MAEFLVYFILGIGVPGITVWVLVKRREWKENQRRYPPLVMSPAVDGKHVEKAWKPLRRSFRRGRPEGSARASKEEILRRYLASVYLGVDGGLPLPFPDALQEFKVETSALPARYVRAARVVEHVLALGPQQALVQRQRRRNGAVHLLGENQRARGARERRRTGRNRRYGGPDP
mgnify:CR=1 FL=1